VALYLHSLVRLHGVVLNEGQGQHYFSRHGPLSYDTLKMEAPRPSKMLVSYHNTEHHYNAKDFNFNIHYCEKFKCRIDINKV